MHVAETAMLVAIVVHGSDRQLGDAIAGRLTSTDEERRPAVALFGAPRQLQQAVTEIDMRRVRANLRGSRSRTCQQRTKHGGVEPPDESRRIYGWSRGG